MEKENCLMSISEIEIHSIAEYISSITSKKTSHTNLWFRGHADSSYALQPTVYRSPYTWKDEIPLLHQFKARAARFISSPPNTDIEWLFIMQHYATPTRLLDWSENALVALAFAIQYRNAEHTDKDAAVWCLDPQKLNINVSFSAIKDEPIPNICENEELQTMFDSPRQEYPVAIIGPQNTDRIIAQRGVFTLFPNKDSFSLETVDNANNFLIKIVIPHTSINSISEDLYYLGITESSLFPELDSISKELKRLYEGR